MELDKLLEEIQNLKDAKELLETIWVEIGPYQHDKVTPKTMNRLQAFFNFDDSD